MESNNANDKNTQCKLTRLLSAEMNEDELAQYESEVARAKADIAAKAETATAKAALLEKLGITEEEAKLLLS